MTFGGGDWELISWDPVLRVGPHYSSHTVTGRDMREFALFPPCEDTVKDDYVRQGIGPETSGSRTMRINKGCLNYPLYTPVIAKDDKDHGGIVLISSVSELDSE